MRTQWKDAQVGLLKLLEENAELRAEIERLKQELAEADADRLRKQDMIDQRGRVSR